MSARDTERAPPPDTERAPAPSGAPRPDAEAYLLDLDRAVKAGQCSASFATTRAYLRGFSDGAATATDGVECIACEGITGAIGNDASQELRDAECPGCGASPFLVRACRGGAA